MISRTLITLTLASSLFFTSAYAGHRDFTQGTKTKIVTGLTVAAGALAYSCWKL